MSDRTSKEANQNNASGASNSVSSNQTTDSPFEPIGNNQDKELLINIQNDTAPNSLGLNALNALELDGDNTENGNSDLKTPPKSGAKLEPTFPVRDEIETKPWLTRMYEVLLAFWPLGLVAFGGPAAHIGLLQTQFVDKYHWVDSSRFVELMAVGQGLPGPTSTQMVIALGATHAGLFGGLLAFFLWNLPSFIILVVVALTTRDRLNPDALPDYLAGLPPAAISLVFIAAYKLGTKVLSVDKSLNQEQYVERVKISLATISTIVTLLVTGEEGFDKRRVSVTFPALLVLGGLATFLDSRRKGKLGNYFRELSTSEKEEGRSVLKRINISRSLGALLVVVFLSILVVFVTLRANGQIGNEGLAALFEAMFRMGSIIYGGGQVVLPMLLTEVVETGWVTEAQFFQGFALVQSLPGPLFNFSAYLGAVYLGIPGALVAWLGLFGPGLVLILAFLPFWMRVRKVPWFQCALVGVNSAAIGLVAAAAIQLWEKAVKSWADAAVFAYTGSFVMFFDPGNNLPIISKLWVPIGVILGGLFGFVLKEINFAQNFD